MFRDRTIRLTLCLFLAFLLPALAGAQDKVRQCSNVQVTVDYKVGQGNWENGAITLKLQDRGAGWLTVSDVPGDRVPVKAARGETYRLNFNDGRHPINVNATGDSHLKVSKGAMAATVLVEITGNSGNGALRFEITGSDSQNAAINGCPGGSVYFRIVG